MPCTPTNIGRRSTNILNTRRCRCWIYIIEGPSKSIISNNLECITIKYYFTPTWMNKLSFWLAYTIIVKNRLTRRKRLPICTTTCYFIISRGIPFNASRSSKCQDVAFLHSTLKNPSFSCATSPFPLSACNTSLNKKPIAAEVAPLANFPPPPQKLIGRQPNQPANHNNLHERLL